MTSATPAHTPPVDGRPREGGLGDRVAGALEELRAEESRRAAVAVSRTGIGIALVIAAGIVFLQGTGALSAARDVLLSVLVAVVVLGVIFAPWIVRTGSAFLSAFRWKAAMRGLATQLVTRISSRFVS